MTEVELGAMPTPQTPEMLSSKVRETKKTETPRSASDKGTINFGDGGLTMYERTKLQIAERERKLKALQEALMADYTFTPKSATNSVASSVSSAERVFERLYSTETAAVRARRSGAASA